MKHLHLKSYLSERSILVSIFLLGAVAIGSCKSRRFGSDVRGVVLKPDSTKSDQPLPPALIWIDEKNPGRVFRGFCKPESNVLDAQRLLMVPANCQEDLFSVTKQDYLQKIRSLAASEFGVAAFERKLEAYNLQIASAKDAESKYSALLEQETKVNPADTSAHRVIEVNMRRIQMSIDHLAHESENERSQLEKRIASFKNSEAAANEAERLLTSKVPFDVHSMTKKENTGVLWPFVNKVMWAAFEDSLEAGRTDSLVAESVQLVRDYLIRKKIQIDLGELNFSRGYNQGSLSQLPFVVFSQNWIFGQIDEFSSLDFLKSFAQNTGPNDRRKMNVANSFSPNEDEPLCKIFLPLIQENGKYNKSQPEMLISGLYETIEEPSPTATLMTFHRVEPRTSNSIARSFFLSCGYVDASSIRLANKKNTEEFDVHIYGSNSVSTSESFTIGEFRDVFKDKSISLRFLE